MKTRMVVVASLLAAVPSLAAPVDCHHNGPQLQMAIDHARPGETLEIYGTCAGGVTISKDLTLAGENGAIIDGGRDQGLDAIQIIGPARVTLKDLQIRNGLNGVHGASAAQLTLCDADIHDNAVNGILLERQSSAKLSDSKSRHNGLSGLDAEASSSVIVTGKLTADSNNVFGVNINGGSSLTLEQGNLIATNNVLGIQFGTSAAGFIADPSSSILAQGNFTTGLTIVSGAHFVAFGGTITSTANQGIGISIDSKAGFDLDAAAIVTSSNNMGDGVHLEETSVLTMFNTTAFSGAPGTTTLNVSNNGGNGISILTGSNLTVIHQATIDDEQNRGFGIFADNGSGLTLIQSKVVNNTAKDVAVTFGSRADISSSDIGRLTCDATALLRGNLAITCPH